MAQKMDLFAASQSSQGLRPGVVAYIKKMPEVKKTYTLIQMGHNLIGLTDLRCTGTDDRQQPDIDTVPVENPGKAVRDDEQPERQEKGDRTEQQKTVR